VIEAEPDEIFGSVTRQAAKVLNVPVSLVTIVDTDPEFWKSHGGIPPDVATGDGLRNTSLCAEAALVEDLLYVEDISEDSRFADDPLLQGRGIQFFVGVPLRTSDGHVVGTLCVTDTESHQVSERARALLRSLSDRLVETVETRKPEEVKGRASG
jgi:GAF domain-containing protein